jgi:hypothetical protein
MALFYIMDKLKFEPTARVTRQFLAHASHLWPKLQLVGGCTPKPLLLSFKSLKSSTSKFLEPQINTKNYLNINIQKWFLNFIFSTTKVAVIMLRQRRVTERYDLVQFSKIMAAGSC